MKHLQRILSLLLVCTMVLSLIPDVLAQEAHTVWTDLLFGDRLFRNQMNFTWTTSAPIPEGGIKWDGTEEFIYVSYPEQPDEIEQSPGELPYIGGQLMFVALRNGEVGSEFADIEQLMANYGIRIIGYIAPTATYQVETVADVDYDSLISLRDQIDAEPAILAGTTNLSYLELVSTSRTSDQTLWNGDALDENNPDGKNWGMEFIKAPSAWTYDPITYPVKAVVWDGGYHEHVDLGITPLIVPINMSADPQENASYFDHGTHVAGTFAARHDSVGVSGVVHNVRLYGVQFRSAFDQFSNQLPAEAIGELPSSFVFADIASMNFGVTVLPSDSPVVVNHSMGRSAYLTGKETDDEKTKTIRTVLSMDALQRETTIDADWYREMSDSWDREREAYQSNIERLDELEYSFLIVQTSGNGFNSNVDGVKGTIDSYYNSALCQMTGIAADHVMGVGAIDWNGGPIHAEFSQVGDCVDILAPGVDIYSTVGTREYDDHKWSGTSMAAPHVAGTAAFVWSIDPSFTAREVRQITNTTFRNIVPRQEDTRRSANNPYPLLNTLAAVETARGQARKATITGKITDDATQLALPDATIRLMENGTLVAETTTDANGAYQFTVKPGVYEVKAEAAFHISKTSAVSVKAAQEKSYDFTLETQGIRLGDYLTLGTYLGEPIVWRCVAIDENGPLMLSDKILCLKAFDAAGSSPTYHTDGWGYIRESYGSNCWSDSSLRQWLNSEAETVPYSHCPPKASGVLSGYNAYDKEAGFLHAFTQEELAKIKTVTQRMYIHEWETHRSGYCDGGTRELEYWPSKRVVDYSPYYYQNVTDRIFLLTPEQADAIYRNFTGYFEKAYPTEAAVKNSSYKASGLSTSKAYPYWLGLPSNIAISYEHAIVSTQNGLDYPRAYDGTCGVRPAFYLDGYTVIH